MTMTLRLFKIVDDPSFTYFRYTLISHVTGAQVETDTLGSSSTYCATLAKLLKRKKYAGITSISLQFYPSNEERAAIKTVALKAGKEFLCTKGA